MKIEGSLQEIKDFIKEFQGKDAQFSKQQLGQIRDELKKSVDEIKIDSITVAKALKSIETNL